MRISAAGMSKIPSRDAAWKTSGGSKTASWRVMARTSKPRRLARAEEFTGRVIESVFGIFQRVDVQIDFDPIALFVLFVLLLMIVLVLAI